MCTAPELYYGSAYISYVTHVMLWVSTVIPSTSGWIPISWRNGATTNHMALLFWAPISSLIYYQRNC